MTIQITTITCPKFLRYSLYLFINIHMCNSTYFEIDFCGSMHPKRWYEQIHSQYCMCTLPNRPTFDDDNTVQGLYFANIKFHKMVCDSYSKRNDIAKIVYCPPSSHFAILGVVSRGLADCEQHTCSDVCCSELTVDVCFF